jgi:hypothetical protein
MYAEPDRPRKGFRTAKCAFCGFWHPARVRLASVLLVALVVCLPAAAAPVPGGRPAVSGTLQVGQRLAAAPGSWSGAGTVTYAFGWYRCDAGGAHCSSIHGATRPSYTTVPKDAGQTLGLTVRATDSTGLTPAYSSLAGPVAPAAATLAATAQPTLTGDPTAGRTLTVVGGAWSIPSTSTATAWLRCNANGRLCTAVAGAHRSSYAVAAGDAGHTIVAQVTAVAGDQRTTVLSLASAVVQATPGPVAVSPPSVSGVLQQGRRLSATAGSWTGSGQVGYAFGWYRCDHLGAHCSSIHGATGSTYTVVRSDVAQTLGLTVRATDSRGTTAAFASLVGPIAPAGSLAATAPPLQSGSAVAGQKLSAGPGSWTQKPSAVAVAWLRCNANGRLCAPIPGATGATYAVTAADRGSTLVAQVTATAGGATQAALGRATPPIG